MVTGILTLAVVNGVLSVGGGALVLVQSNRIQRARKLLVPLLAGVLLATALLDLLPDTLPFLYTEAFIWFLGAIAVLFTIELGVHRWEAAPASISHGIYSLAATSVIHNVMFGALIAVLATNFSNGLEVAIFLALSDIPHEMGIFGVLTKRGLTAKKALWLQLAVTLPTVVGAAIGYVFKTDLYGVIPILLAILAGWFFYIAVFDLFHDMREQLDSVPYMQQVIVFIIGILLVAWMLRHFDSAVFGVHPLYITHPL